MVLSTDGTATFATILHNYGTLRNEDTIEFTSGGRRFFIPTNNFEEINLFRIDGMLKYRIAGNFRGEKISWFLWFK